MKSGTLLAAFVICLSASGLSGVARARKPEQVEHPQMCEGSCARIRLQVQTTLRSACRHRARCNGPEAILMTFLSWEKQSLAAVVDEQQIQIVI